jgi:hypothetical protein
MVIFIILYLIKNIILFIYLFHLNFITLILIIGSRSDNSRESHHERHIESINKNINRFIDEINTKSNTLGEEQTSDLLAKVDELKNLELQAANNRMQTAIDMKNLKSSDLTSDAR